MMLQLCFGATDVNVNTTSTLSRLLAATHRRYESNPAQPRRGRPARRSISIDIPPPSCSPEFALRSAQREIAAQVAAVNGWLAVQAVVVARNERALALIGRPASGRSTIAAHLLSRGWQLVSDDVAFIDAARATVLPHEGLMSFRSGAIPYLPHAFRGSLERSGWFVEHGEIAFYEVDPAGAFGAEVWSGEAALDAVIIVDEAQGMPGIDAVSRDNIVLHAVDGRLVPLGEYENLRLGIIKLGRARWTADYIERWYDAHVGA